MVVKFLLVFSYFLQLKKHIFVFAEHQAFPHTFSYILLHSFNFPFIILTALTIINYLLSHKNNKISPEDLNY